MCRVVNPKKYLSHTKIQNTQKYIPSSFTFIPDQSLFAHPAVCRPLPHRYHCVKDPPGSLLQLSALSLTPLAAAVFRHHPPAALSPSLSKLIHRRRRRRSTLPLTSAANHCRRCARCPQRLMWRATSTSHHLHRTSLRY